jgi:hypothetical protein
MPFMPCSIYRRAEARSWATPILDDTLDGANPAPQSGAGISSPAVHKALGALTDIGIINYLELSAKEPNQYHPDLQTSR